MGIHPNEGSMSELEQRFFQFENDYLKFFDVINKRSNRPDLHAFLLMDELQPGSVDMISAAEHDKFYLSIDMEELEEIITDAQIQELTRCGVNYSEEYGSLFMFT